MGVKMNARAATVGLGLPKITIIREARIGDDASAPKR
jgi:hypothetical protein